MNHDTLPLVSMVIPMRNEEKYIGRCLQSITAQQYPQERIEVLVVDGMSTDSSRRIVNDVARVARFPIQIVDNPRRITSRGLNLGIQRAQGEIIGITSAHSTLDPAFISEGVRLIQERNVECASSPITSIGEGIVAQAIALAMSHPFGVGDARFRYSRREEMSDAAAFALYKREVFERLGGFKASMPDDSDSDFHYRLIESGGHILQSPKIKSHYYVRATMPSLFRQYFRYGMSKIVVMRRYPHRIKIRQIVPSLFVTGLLGSGLLGLFNKDARNLFRVILGNYLLISLTTSASISAKSGWRYLPFLPVAFACLHTSYGVGLLRAIAGWMIANEKRELLED